MTIKKRTNKQEINKQTGKIIFKKEKKRKKPASHEGKEVSEP